VSQLIEKSKKVPVCFIIPKASSHIKRTDAIAHTHFPFQTLSPAIINQCRLYHIPQKIAIPFTHFHQKNSVHQLLAERGLRATSALSKWGYVFGQPYPETQMQAEIALSNIAGVLGYHPTVHNRFSGPQ